MRVCYQHQMTELRRRIVVVDGKEQVVYYCPYCHYQEEMINNGTTK